MVSGGMSCVKYLLFTFNLLFVVSGIIILSVGAVVLGTFNTYDSFTNPSVVVGPVLLIIVGVVVFIVAFFGCCGAVKENHCMVVTFSVLLLIIFTLELAGGIAGYVLKDVIKDDIETQLNKTLPTYNNDKEMKKSWDIMQSDLHCCGIHGPVDWINANMSIPNSCCANVDVNVPCAITEAYKPGCVKSFEDFINHNALIIGGVGIGIAFVQLVGVILACCLAKSIRREYETV